MLGVVVVAVLVRVALLGGVASGSRIATPVETLRVELDRAKSALTSAEGIVRLTELRASNAHMKEQLGEKAAEPTREEIAAYIDAKEGIPELRLKRDTLVRLLAEAEAAQAIKDAGSR